MMRRTSLLFLSLPLPLSLSLILPLSLPLSLILELIELIKLITPELMIMIIHWR
jgi:hypothetical protein